MNADKNLKHSDLTETILGVFYKVYNTLGYGFLEKVYERAMAVEFRKQGIAFRTQVPVSVYYDGEPVGEYIADLVVADKVIVEIKAIKTLTKVEESQLLNYLTATGMEVGLLLNFGPKPEFRRKVYENSRKHFPKVSVIRENQRKSASP